MQETNLLKYLNKLKLSMSDVEKVKEMVKTTEYLTCEEIMEIFITDYLIGEERNFKNLFFFSAHFLVECKKFQQNDEFNLYRLSNSINRVSHSVKSFNFTEVNNKSRFHLEILTKGKDLIEMKATGNNCSSLFEVYKNYILPNIL